MVCRGVSSGSPLLTRPFAEMDEVVLPNAPNFYPLLDSKRRFVSTNGVVKVETLSDPRTVLKRRIYTPIH